jgi:hypothetical protein
LFANCLLFPFVSIKIPAEADFPTYGPLPHFFTLSSFVYVSPKVLIQNIFEFIFNQNPKNCQILWHPP